MLKSLNRTFLFQYLGTTAQSIDLAAIDYQQYYIEFGCMDVADGKSDCECFVFVLIFALFS